MFRPPNCTNRDYSEGFVHIQKDCESVFPEYLDMGLDSQLELKVPCRQVGSSPLTCQ